MLMLNKSFTFSKDLPEQYTNQLKDVNKVGKH